LNSVTRGGGSRTTSRPLGLVERHANGLMEVFGAKAGPQRARDRDRITSGHENAFGVDVTPTPNFDLPATFQGIRRPDGRVATRNYIGILTSVNCSAHVAGMVADVFKKNPFTGDNPLADFPNVDGVVALTHKTGCGMTQDEPLALLRRTLGGYARHVNFPPWWCSGSAARSTRSAA